MDRSDAERVIALVAEIGGDLRGRIISERWWLVWIAVGVHMLVASTLLQVLLWHGEDRPPVLASLLFLYAVILFIIIRFIHRRAGGQRTATETYLWWIWTSHILCTLVLPLLEALAGLLPFQLAPVLGLLSGFAFSMMAMVTHRWFLTHALFFAAVAVAMSALAHYQFLLYGIAWFVVLVGLGVSYRLSSIAPAGRSL
jgi:hypothetical protein